jgi:hypothetical protein
MITINMKKTDMQFKERKKGKVQERGGKRNRKRSGNEKEGLDNNASNANMGNKRGERKKVRKRGSIVG